MGPQSKVWAPVMCICTSAPALMRARWLCSACVAAVCQPFASCLKAFAFPNPFARCNPFACLNTFACLYASICLHTFANTVPNSSTNPHPLTTYSAACSPPRIHPLTYPRASSYSHAFASIHPLIHTLSNASFHHTW